MHVCTRSQTPPRSGDFGQGSRSNEGEMRWKLHTELTKLNVKVKEQKGWWFGALLISAEKIKARSSWMSRMRRAEIRSGGGMRTEIAESDWDPSGGNRSDDSRRVLDPSVPAVWDSQDESQGLPSSKTPGDSARPPAICPLVLNHLSVTERHVCYDGLWITIVPAESGWLITRY